MFFKKTRSAQIFLALASTSINTYGSTSNLTPTVLTNMNSSQQFTKLLRMMKTEIKDSINSTLFLSLQMRLFP